MATTPTFPLADVLANVADELIRAESMARLRGKAVMQFEECEVELSVKVEVEAGGGFKVWVVELSGKAKREEANKLRVKMKAIPSSLIQAPQLASVSPPAKTVRKQANANPNSKR
jgi:hypothetical protein